MSDAHQDDKVKQTARKHESLASFQQASSQSDLDAIEPASTQDNNRDAIHEKSPSRPSLRLKRTASTVLSKAVSRVTTRSLREPGPPPDGGLKACTQVAMGWLVIFTTWGYVNSFAAFQTYYTSTLREPPSTISWIGSVQVWLTFFIGAFSGRLLDAGLFVPTFAVGTVLQLLGVFMMSLSTRYWQLMLTQGMLTGIGGGIFFCPSMSLIATYFSKRRALAIGIATTGNSAGGMIYPVIVRELLPKLGFAWTARVLGFVNLGCLCLVLALMRPRLPPRTSGPVIDLSAFKEPVYVLFVGGIYFGMWAVYYTFYYIASFGVEAIGLPYSQSALLVIIINGSGFLARIIPALIADTTGPLNIMVPVLFCVAVVAYTWLAVSSVTGFFIWTALYGVVSAAFQCLFPTTIASLTPDLNMVGTRLGMAFSLISFAALTGPPLGGALQSADHGRFRGAQLWAATATLLCAVLVGMARVVKVGWKLNAKC